MILEKAIQIELGAGKIQISHFTDSDGRGLVFFDTETPHQIGATSGEPDNPAHVPQPGEIYLKCANLESATVLREMVNEMCDRFTSPNAQD